MKQVLLQFADGTEAIETIAGAGEGKYSYGERKADIELDTYEFEEDMETFFNENFTGGKDSMCGFSGCVTTVRPTKFKKKSFVYSHTALGVEVYKEFVNDVS